MLRAAHDLANMLTVTLGYCELAEKHPDQEQARDHAAKARRAAQRCVELVHSVFAAARNTAEAYDLNVVVDELAEGIEGANMLPADIRLELRLDRRRESTRVVGDSMGMSRILLNLCLNARDAMVDRGGGTLTVTTRGEDNGWVTLQVMDTGKGMSVDELARLWDSHVTADRRHGYGLAIVKSSLDKAQGRIMVESAPGEGTIFTISLKSA
jgi:two-component system cell cycle sensor histidine kinase/response regulator CckA